MAVWGGVIYRFVSRGRQPPQPRGAAVAPASASAAFEYSLIAGEVDPFGVVEKARREAPERETAPEPETPRIDPRIQAKYTFPDLRFVGYVETPGKPPRAIVRFGGRSTRMTPGDELAGAELVSVEPETATFHFSGLDSGFTLIRKFVQ